MRSVLRRRSSFTRGFASAMAVSLISAGAIALSITVMSMSAAYSDAVSKKEQRIQAGLDAIACEDTFALIRDKNKFVSGIVGLPEFGCEAAL